MAITSGIIKHRWDLKPSEALQLQEELRSKVVLAPLDRPLYYIGGAAVAFHKSTREMYAAMVVLDYKTQELVAYATLITETTFPYIPGLLSFRELPALLQAWHQLPLIPNLMMTDSQGIAHPRRMGEACHFGLLTGIPSIGCAQKHLHGIYTARTLQKGNYSALLDEDEVIGYALCTKDKVKPVFVSPAYAVDLEESRDIALHCAKGYKLPEPIRQAHLLVNRLRNGERKAEVWKKEG